MESIDIGGATATSNDNGDQDGAQVPDPPTTPEPAAAGDGSTSTGDGTPIPAGKLKVPEDTNGHYVVVMAQKPKRGQKAQYIEVACVKAHDPSHAKRIVLEEDGRTPKPTEQRGELARWLLAQAGEGKGILLRAVPAMHWPGEVEPTTFVRPAPVLQIG